MQAEDIVGSWISDEIIQADGTVKKRGLIRGKLTIAADGTAQVKVGFLKFKANWTIEDDAVSLLNTSTKASVGSLTLVDGCLHMANSQDTIMVYVRA